MALWGNIFLNTRNIGGWEAVRVTNTDTDKPDDDAVSTYKWQSQLQGVDGRWKKLEGTVEHRYGDGAPALASKVLGAIDVH